MTDYDSRATRYLSAGVYVDDTFRDAVIDELWRHEERVVAPSYGFSAVPLLAHALRARRIAVLHAVLGAVLWILGFVLLGGYFLFFAVPSVALLGAAALSGAATGPVQVPGAPTGGRPLSVPRRWAAGVLRAAGRLLMLLYFAASLAGPVLGDAARQDVRDWGMPLPDDAAAAGLALLVPLLMSTVVAFHGWRVGRTISGPRFHQRTFETAGPRGRRAEARIREEQKSPLLLYGAGSPFVGAGTALTSTVVTTRLDSSRAGELRRELDGSRLLDDIASRVHPAFYTRTAPGAAIEPCVFLPAHGLSGRRPPRSHVTVWELRHDAEMDDDRSPRRTYLRIRVGGADGGVVTTAFVRVRSRRGFLSLEIAPHVLRPVRRDYRDIYQHFAEEAGRRTTFLVNWLQAIGHTPATAAGYVVALARQGAALGAPGRNRREARPVDGPQVSLRELASEPAASHFELIDVETSLEIIRIQAVAAVRAALRAEGYEAGAFDQSVVDVVGGGNVSIGPVSGSAFGVDHREAAGPGRPTGWEPRGHGPPGPTTNPDDDEWPEA